jgi:two-component system LytT family sensor kinase
LTISDPILNFKHAFRQQFKMLFGNKRYLLHVLLWILIGLYLDWGSWSENLNINVNNQNSNEAVLGDPTSYFLVGISMLLAGIIVYNYLLLFVPLAIYKKRRRFLWIGLIANATLWIIIIFILGLIVGYSTTFESGIGTKKFVVAIILACVYSLIISAFFFSLYYFIDLYDKQKSLNLYKQIFASKLTAESNFLKSQINPHFLFNTLNNVYSLSLTQPEKATDLTIKLKSLINYMTEDCSQDSVNLEDEIRFIEHYIIRH